MTEGKKKPGAVWHGMVPDTDPIYRGGRNFLVGKNLPPPSNEKAEEAHQRPRLPHCGPS
jgi:hypothetical protein